MKQYDPCYRYPWRWIEEKEKKMGIWELSQGCIKDF